MFEHGYVSDEELGTAQQNIRDATALLRSDSRIDPNRVGMWFFSGGGYFMGSVLAEPAAWGVAAVAGTYAAVERTRTDGLPLRAATLTAEQSDIPMLLVRPEHDYGWIVAATDRLLDRCRSARRLVDVIEVPGSHHGFETVDDTDAARAAIRDSISWWARTLG